jgi:hypothetical protein
MPYPKGSEWRRWDLHIHTPFSILNNKFPWKDGFPNWDECVAHLEASGVAVVGVTDYFTIEGYKALRELQKKGHLQGITLMPNIEFRVDKIVASKKDGEQPRRLNFQVLLSEDVGPDEIEEHLLHDLYFNYQGTPGDKADQRKLKPSNLQDLGSKLIAEHPPFKDMPPVQVGAMNAVVNLEHLVDVLTKGHRFKDKYVLVLADEYSNLIPWDGQDHQTRKVLVQQADMIFTSNAATVDDGLSAFLRWLDGYVPTARRGVQRVDGGGAARPRTGTAQDIQRYTGWRAWARGGFGPTYYVPCVTISISIEALWSTTFMSAPCAADQWDCDPLGLECNNRQTRRVDTTSKRRRGRMMAASLLHFRKIPRMNQRGPSAAAEYSASRTTTRCCSRRFSSRARARGRCRQSSKSWIAFCGGNERLFAPRSDPAWVSSLAVTVAFRRGDVVAGAPACNGVQGATASLVFPAPMATWNL